MSRPLLPRPKQGYLRNPLLAYFTPRTARIDEKSFDACGFLKICQRVKSGERERIGLFSPSCVPSLSLSLFTRTGALASSCLGSEDHSRPFSLYRPVISRTTKADAANSLLSFLPDGFQSCLRSRFEQIALNVI